MIEMRMTQDHRIDFGCIKGEGVRVARLVLPAALDQAAIQQNFPSGGVNNVA
jgi:hypothetical protein